jgi:hypothetical protein
MGLRLGPILAGVSAGAKSLQGDREKKEAKQMMLEDRIKQQEMRDLQMRKLEDELNRPAAPEPLVVTLDDQGNPVHTPRSQAAGKRAPRAAEPLEVVIGPTGPTYTPRSQAAGKAAPKPAEPIVQTVGPDGRSIYTTRSEAIGQQAPQPAGQTGAADRRKRGEALSNVAAALDSFERNLVATGSQILPSAEKDALQTDYENLQLQLKELFNLGVLNGPDLALMRRIIQDPTSIQGRALSAGRGDEQTRRVLKQVETMRAKLGTFRASAGVEEATPKAGVPDHSELSDEEFAKLYKAGAFKKP